MLSMSRNVLLLLFLYFMQGLPYGFQTQLLPLRLRALGHDLTNVSLMRLLHAPWLCKAIWAPLVDKVGTKRKWLLGSIACLIFTCLLGGLICSDNLMSLCAILFLLNLFCATQDIAVDGIAVALLGSHELGSGNTAQVVGYKIGSIFGGGVLIWFMDQVGWFGLFISLAVLYVEALMFVYVSPSLRYFEGRLSEIEDMKRRISEWQNQASKYGDQTADWEDFNLENEEIDPQMESQAQSSKDAETKETENDNTDGNGGEESQCDPVSNSEATQNVHNNEAEERSHQTNAPQGENSSQNIEDSSNLSFEDEDIDADNITMHMDGKSKLSMLKQLMSVPGTRWMMVFVLIYKLGEQGALGMLPLYLVDQKVSAGEVGFWTGVVGQGVSIFGSLMGGWLISNNKLPVQFLLQQFCLLRLLPLGVQLLLVVAWSMQVLSSHMLLYPALGTMMVLLLLSGMVTTATFTFMMQCSRLAPTDLQATHYTTLATLEVFGKLLFMTLSGWLVDRLGFPFMFLVFTSLTLLSVLWFRKCPKDFLSHYEFDEDSEYEYQWESMGTKEKCD